MMTTRCNIRQYDRQLKASKSKILCDMKTIILKYSAFFLILLATLSCCKSEESVEPTGQEKFCSYLNTENIDKTIPVVNDFLNGLSSGEEVAITELEAWLRSCPCVVDASVITINQFPLRSQIGITFSENGRIENRIMELSMTKPLKVAGYGEYDALKVKFCSNLTVANIDKTIPVIDEYLRGLSGESDAVRELEAWLKSFPYIIEASVVNINPLRSQIDFSFNEKGITKRFIMYLSMNNPMRVERFREFDKLKADFCSCITVENIDMTIPVINEFLSELPNSMSSTQKIKELVTWLKSCSCITNIMDYSPNIYISFDKNGTTRTRILEISMSNPMKVARISGSGCDCDDELFYYYQGNKFFLDDVFLNDWLLIGFYQSAQDSEIVDYLSQTGLFKPVDESNIFYHAKEDENDYHLIFVNTKSQKTCLQLKEIVRTLEKSSIVAYANLCFDDDNCHGFYCTNIMASTSYFAITSFYPDDISNMYLIMTETNTRIFNVPFQYLPGVYILTADKNSKGNAMQMSQYFYEKGKFEIGIDFLTARVNR